MSARTRTALVAAALSLVVPGAGHLYAGARRRALVLLAIWIVLCALALVLAVAAPADFALGAVGPALLVGVLAANAALLAFRAFAILDAWRLRAPAGRATVAVVALVAAAAAPHVAAAYVTVRSFDVLESVFADEEPQDVLPSNGVFLAVARLLPAAPPRDVDPPSQRSLRRVAGPAPAPFRGPAKPLVDAHAVLADEAEASRFPWVTILLLGSDEGPGQAGDRTDTMIVAAMQRQTRRAVLLGIPRNLVAVPLETQPPTRFAQPLNALYAYANGRPDLFPRGGASALKQAVSRLLGIRVDYHALVDLDGFVEVVDALGGVKIHVKERIVDSVTRPAWRETKPRIDVHPGRTYHFTGRTALAYVRSRKASSDYRRMARQRCFLSALADQLDVVSVLRHFGSLASAVETSVRTDLPLDRVPDLARLAAGVDARKTLTETFGEKYFAGRRGDGYPLPNVAKIHAAVRDAILHPDRARAYRAMASTKESC